MSAPIQSLWRGSAINATATRTDDSNVGVPSSSLFMARGRRRKSRSPDLRDNHGFRLFAAPKPLPDTASGGKNKRPLTTPAPVVDEASFSRGRVAKAKGTHPLHSLPRATTQNAAVPKRDRLIQRERSRSHESVRNRKPTSNANINQVLAQDTKQAATPEYSGPLAAAEFTRLKKDNEQLEKQGHDYRKIIRKQTKMIEDLKKSVTDHTKTMKDKDSQITKLKVKARKAEETISNIEINMACQICMEILCKPYALSPCGHILCLTCLQEWFRKAPPNLDDMYDDDPNDPDYILYRRKYCPCCRAEVKHRPVPVFLVKSIATTLIKAKSTRSTGKQASPPVMDPDTDVWVGLFPEVHEEEDYDDGNEGEEEIDFDDDDDDDDDSGEDAEYSSSSDQYFAYGTDSDTEPYNGIYVPARWQPPTVTVDSEDYAFSDINEEQLTMVRRGVTLPMIERYQMYYTHQDGLVAICDDGDGICTVYLGWSVCLDEDDTDGVEFMNWIIHDAFERPHRWDVRVGERDGEWEARRLVKPEDVSFYDTTDTEEWVERDLE